MRLRSIPRLALSAIAVVALLPISSFCGAEKISDLPAHPSGYVTDNAGVLSDDAKVQLEQLCQQVDTQAHAQIAIVIIKSLDGESIEEFSNDLFTKWGVGQKGTDRGVMLLLSIQDRKRRIEVGYGLEGILPDGKAGDIGRDMVPALQQNNYDAAVETGTGEIAQVIADDAHVTLTPIPAQTQEYQQRSHGSPGGIFIFLLFLFLVAVFGGRSGVLGFLLGSFLGGGFGGGDDRRGGGWGGGGGGFGDGGGGFGGFGGGGSGGGGASGGW